MRGERVRWVLAYDIGCAQCRTLSQSVQDAVDGELEILPLSDSLVRTWVARARPGRPLRWRPMLFRVDGPSVKVWTGAALSLRLLRHLGPRASSRVLRALAVAGANGPAGAADAAPATTRRRFLQLGAGGLIAAGILVAGASPVAADPLAAWRRANRGRMPRTYADVAALPLPYRSIAYQDMTPAERSAAWVAHLTQARAALPPLTPEQAAILDETLALAADPAHFLDDGPPPPQASDLARRGMAAFGLERARALFATLGPADEAAVALASCGCSTISNYCGGPCHAGGCTPVPGCGFLWQYTCNGRCG